MNRNYGPKGYVLVFTLVERPPVRTPDSENVAMGTTQVSDLSAAAAYQLGCCFLAMPFTNTEIAAASTLLQIFPFRCL